MYKKKCQWKEIIIIDKYAPNTGTLNFIKQTLLHKGDQINISSDMGGDLNTSESQIDQVDKKGRAIGVLLNTLEQVDLRDIERYLCRVFQQ